ncbi:carbonic anhydrase 6-like [Boleophthalmus pectinirostris]|uniref:carbonic anhydrase 6-like n=1 Tax=Boleophthalmus pectinirostris TaxID=150288 RepID=UPI00242A9BD5|nr:carbonic anhydrase 6-like [Boleophthalmus pectinirostris]
MGWIILGVVCVWLIPVIVPAASDFVWCYLDPSCNDAAWVTLAPKYCAGSRQSPIDIVSKNATYDGNLTALKLNNFNSKTALTKIENTGHTVKVTLASGVSVSGGGLTERYDSLQFHLHWGKGTSVPGSEHTLDGKRFPMEFHIVSLKSSYNGNTTAATADPTGAAALGFLIEVSDNTTGEPASWKTLTSYLSKITQKGNSCTTVLGICGPKQDFGCGAICYKGLTLTTLGEEKILIQLIQVAAA